MRVTTHKLGMRLFQQLLVWKAQFFRTQYLTSRKIKTADISRSKKTRYITLELNQLIKAHSKIDITRIKLITYTY